MLPNATNDPGKLSWVDSANLESTDFPIQNLPVGLFRVGSDNARGGIALGDQIIDLAKLSETGLLSGLSKDAAQAASGSDLLPLFTLGREYAEALRERISMLFDRGVGQGDLTRLQRQSVLVPQRVAEMRLPITVRSFSDMCMSTFHIGRRVGNDANGQPICPPVFRRQPVGYDGRASSVVVSGAPVRRPNGQWLAPSGDGAPQFGPEPQQDYELEMGLWLGGPANDLGTPICIGAAREKLFGFCLLNDWSARGIQMWETMLGPFLGKSLCTSISPWIILPQALAPFATRAFERPEHDPAIPAHLHDADDQSLGGFDIKLQAALVTEAMQASRQAPQMICETNFKYMYWTWLQILTHHASNGCSLGAGDLLGSGTCSGPDLAEAACLLERVADGGVALPDGTRRLWLEDGDTVILRARAERRGFRTIGFGEVRGTLQPAPSWPT